MCNEKEKKKRLFEVHRQSVTLCTDLGLQRRDLLLHILLALFLFLQHLPQVVLLVLHLPQAGGEAELLASLLFKQLLDVGEGKKHIRKTYTFFSRSVSALNI